MKKITIMLMFSALILFALEFKTTEKVKATDADWIVFMENDLDSLQRDSIGNIVSDRIRDSLNQARVNFSGDIKVKGNDLYYGNGASTTNPSSGIYSINAPTVSIPADSTNAGQVLHADTTKTNVIILPNGAVVSNVHADSLRLTEANTIIDGNAKLNGLLTLTEGTSTTFTQATKRLTIAGDSLSIRAMTNINPYRATSPQTSTFIGMLAGKSGTTGAGNVVMGYQAGQSLTTATYNTFMGYAAGNKAAGAASSYNSFYGGNSGNVNTGISNTAIGYSAGRVNTTGSYNSFLGFYSAYLNTTGSYCVAIGDSSGYNNTTGSRNVFIGYKAIGTATSSDQFILQSDNGSKVQRLMQGSFADSSLTINGYTNHNDSIRVGFAGGSNYTTIEKDGTIALHGTATTWRDEESSLLGFSKVTGSTDIETRDSSATVCYLATADHNDYLFSNIQLNHDRKIGSQVGIHIHWKQTQADSIGWKIGYRWQVNGQQKAGDWKYITVSHREFTWTTGVLNQITDFGLINFPSTDGLSDILQLKISRDDAVAIDVHAYSADVHIECDGLGSRTEYGK